MKRNSKIVIGVIALLIVVGLCIGRKLILWYTDNKQPNFSHETVLYVYPGMSRPAFLASERPPFFLCIVFIHSYFFS